MNRYQTFWKRIIATLIDGLVFLPMIILNFWIVDAEVSDRIYFVVALVEAIFGIGYSVLLHWKYGQTLGKMVVKVRVLDISEKPINFWQALLRDVAYITDGVLYLAVMLTLFEVGYSRTMLFESIGLYLSIPILVWLAIDTVVCIKNRKYRALHDFIAGTVVVRLDVLNDSDDALFRDPPSPDLYDELRNLSKHFARVAEVIQLPFARK